MTVAKVAVIYYSTWGHIRTLAKAEVEGLAKAGIKADLYQVQETLPEEVLTKMHAPPKADDPVASPDTLTQYDAFLFGVPTRYGNQPAQWRTFWDATGQLWASQKLAGKYAGFFVATAGPCSGAENTVMSGLSTLAHHGVNFVPNGYWKSGAQLGNLEEIHGGGPLGASTYAKSDGSRQPTELELEIARLQGEGFGEIVNKVNF